MMSGKQLEAFVDGIVTCIKKTIEGPRVEGRFASVEARLESAETRLTQLAARPAVKYAGVWRSGAYCEGSIVTKSGGLWYATRTTGLTPGVPDSGWTLIVKSGGAER